MKIKVLWSLITPKNYKTLARLKKSEYSSKRKGIHSRPLSNVLRGDRRALIEHSKSTVAAKHHNFSHTRVTVAALTTRRIDPKRPKNGQIFLAPGYRIPGYPARRGAGAPKMMLGYPDRTDPIIPYRVKYRNPELASLLLPTNRTARKSAATAAAVQPPQLWTRPTAAATPSRAR